MKKIGNMNGREELRIKKLNNMNKIKAILFCASLIFSFQLSNLNSAQAQVKWHTIEEAASAKIGERLYFVDFYTHWCGYCKKMDRETFTDPTVVKILNKYCYPVKFNAEGDNTFTWAGKTYRPATGNSRMRTHEFARGLQGYPTFSFFNADGTLLQSIPGFVPAADFIVILWYIVNGDYERYPYERYRQMFDKEIRPQMKKALSEN